MADTVVATSTVANTAIKNATTGDRILLNPSGSFDNIDLRWPIASKTLRCRIGGARN